jgi:hypothetical protein
MSSIPLTTHMVGKSSLLGGLIKQDNSDSSQGNAFTQR